LPVALQAAAGSTASATSLSRMSHQLGCLMVPSPCGLGYSGPGATRHAHRSACLRVEYCSATVDCMDGGALHVTSPAASHGKSSLLIFRGSSPLTCRPNQHTFRHRRKSFVERDDNNYSPPRCTATIALVASLLDGTARAPLPRLSTRSCAGSRFCRIAAIHFAAFADDLDFRWTSLPAPSSARRPSVSVNLCSSSAYFSSSSSK